eukprot:CAMPEP_0184692510 /NCGR_PEP_ID=MMETSP0313-20130426/963_1 /TAXON_ID=2792 /ORGANISM="Porphyridium aerugineum, Strain SAG 1380-2" /LENGTH=685 /DNA_ID=CAMNT_0027150347 /DNA_START=300 /DNA_END=2357 /DNA_ORIENTATION=+
MAAFVVSSSFLGTTASITHQKNVSLSSIPRSKNAAPRALKMVATNPAPSTTSGATGVKLSKVEGIKTASNHLRFPLGEEFANEETHISEDAIQVMKFHGSYQQDDREKRVAGKSKHYQFMLRLKMPAGEFPANMYQVLDNLSDEYGNHTLRATTRCAWQMHGVLKGNMKTVLSTIMNAGGGTQGACGDINRNIVATPAPFQYAPYTYVREYAKYIAEILAPQTGAFAELWLDGEKAATLEYWKKDIDMNKVKKAIHKETGHGVIIPNNEEPIYGDTYLPRKFKIGITVPGDNSIDIYTQDIGLVVITKRNGELDGFNVIVGGGMGRTHGKENTFPRTGDHLGFVPKNKIFDLVKAIVATQRDNGNREHRPNARMKYLVDKVGIDKFREMVESYYGERIKPFKKLPTWKYEDWLGWHDQGDGKLFLGLFIQNGRIKDDGDFMLKSALRTIVNEMKLDMVVSPNQNIILKNIEPQYKRKVQAILTEHGVMMADEYSRNQVTAMACPAFPLCGLAVTEAERHMPDVVDRVEELLSQLGLRQQEIIMRMTGCPNGCTRPYMAEIGFVGSGPMTYQLWIGGAPNSTRLAFALFDKMKDDDIEKTLEPLFVNYKLNRKSRKESFGDFCARIGKEGLLEYSSTYELGSYMKSKKTEPRVNLKSELYAKVVAKAEAEGVSVRQLVEKIISEKI